MSNAIKLELDQLDAVVGGAGAAAAVDPRKAQTDLIDAATTAAMPVAAKATALADMEVATTQSSGGLSPARAAEIRANPYEAAKGIVSVSHPGIDFFSLKFASVAQDCILRTMGNLRAAGVPGDQTRAFATAATFEYALAANGDTPSLRSSMLKDWCSTDLNRDALFKGMALSAGWGVPLTAVIDKISAFAGQYVAENAKGGGEYYKVFPGVTINNANQEQHDNLMRAKRDTEAQPKHTQALDALANAVMQGLDQAGARGGNLAVFYNADFKTKWAASVGDAATTFADPPALLRALVKAAITIQGDATGARAAEVKAASRGVASAINALLDDIRTSYSEGKAAAPGSLNLMAVAAKGLCAMAASLDSWKMNLNGVAQGALDARKQASDLAVDLLGRSGTASGPALTWVNGFVLRALRTEHDSKGDQAIARGLEDGAMQATLALANNQNVVLATRVSQLQDMARIGLPGAIEALQKLTADYKIMKVDWLPKLAAEGVPGALAAIQSLGRDGWLNATLSAIDLVAARKASPLVLAQIAEAANFKTFTGALVDGLCGSYKARNSCDMAFEGLLGLAASGRTDAIDALRSIILKPGAGSDLLDRAFGSLKTLADRGIQAVFPSLQAVVTSADATPDLRKRAFATLSALAEAGNTNAFAVLGNIGRAVGRMDDPNIEAFGVLTRVALKGGAAALTTFRDVILNDATTATARTVGFFELSKMYVDEIPVPQANRGRPSAGPQGAAFTPTPTVYGILNELARSAKPAVARDAIDTIAAQARTNPGAILSLEAIARSSDATLRRTQAAGWLYELVRENAPQAKFVAAALQRVEADTASRPVRLDIDALAATAKVRGTAADNNRALAAIDKLAEAAMSGSAFGQKWDALHALSRAVQGTDLVSVRAARQLILIAEDNAALRVPALAQANTAATNLVLQGGTVDQAFLDTVRRIALSPSPTTADLGTCMSILFAVGARLTQDTSANGSPALDVLKDLAVNGTEAVGKLAVRTLAQIADANFPGAWPGKVKTFALGRLSDIAAAGSPVMFEALRAHYDRSRTGSDPAWDKIGLDWGYGGKFSSYAALLTSTPDLTALAKQGYMIPWLPEKEAASNPVPLRAPCIQDSIYAYVSVWSAQMKHAGIPADKTEKAYGQLIERLVAANPDYRPDQLRALGWSAVWRAEYGLAPSQVQAGFQASELTLGVGANAIRYSKELPPIAAPSAAQAMLTAHHADILKGFMLEGAAGVPNRDWMTMVQLAIGQTIQAKVTAPGAIDRTPGAIPLVPTVTSEVVSIINGSVSVLDYTLRQMNAHTTLQGPTMIYKTIGLGTILQDPTSPRSYAQTVIDNIGGAFTDALLPDAFTPSALTSGLITALASGAATRVLAAMNLPEPVNGALGFMIKALDFISSGWKDLVLQGTIGAGLELMATTMLGVGSLFQDLFTKPKNMKESVKRFQENLAMGIASLPEKTVENLGKVAITISEFFQSVVYSVGDVFKKI